MSELEALGLGWAQEPPPRPPAVPAPRKPRPQLCRTRSPGSTSERNSRISSFCGRPKPQRVGRGHLLSPGPPGAGLWAWYVS